MTLEFTWPVCSIYEDEDFVGYVMPHWATKYVTLSRYINKKARQVGDLPEFLPLDLLLPTTSL